MVCLDNDKSKQLLYPATKKNIQPHIKKYIDYTHQKLVEEEEIIRGNMSDMSSEIKTIEFNIKDTKNILSKSTVSL